VNDSLPSPKPENTALLVMDYQPFIVEMLPDGAALVARAAQAIAIARSLGAHVGYVRVAFSEEDFDRLPDRNKMAAFVKGTGKAFHSDAPATAVHDGVAPKPGDIVVRKTRVGAFSTTDLDAQLRGRGITNVILAGISTSGVVLSTVRDAADRDYQVFVLADASGDPQQDVHEFLIEKIFPRQAHVISIADLDRLFG
jgi:nicotinamidase-related amidase